MARPKSNTKEGRAAAEKWRQTMLEKYGSDGFHKKMQSVGFKGGSAGRGPNCLKGFAANPELARKFGGIGGRKSSRKGVKNGCGKNAVKDIEAAEKILAHELEHEGW